jgi:glycosyltransferase involved in cell wall biosynthesis
MINYKHEVAVAAVFKNESHALREWITHYLSSGFDHIYLIDDGSTDNFLPLINVFIESGKVTLYRNSIASQQVGRQIEIYRNHLSEAARECKWLAIFDLDEFFFLERGSSVKSFLSENESYSQLIIKWKHFGSSGHLLQPRSIVESFTYRAKMDNDPSVGYYGMKYIVKIKDLVSIDVHKCQVTGATKICEEAWLNHYAIQSWEYFSNVKMTRGDVNKWFDHVGLKRDEKYFHCYDVNEVFDDSLARRNSSILNKVTVVITSCNRPDLLRHTMLSFLACNTYPIEEFIIVEDSGIHGINDFCYGIIPGKVTLLYNEKNIGQSASIERAYSRVKTDYIFHCEEDWEFYKPGFIEASFDLLRKDPKMFTVWLRSHHDTNNHPIVVGKHGLEMSRDFRYGSYSWGGFTFNPGLRSTNHAMMFCPLTNFTTECEYNINKLYQERGIFSAITSDPTGYVRHIGWGRHIKRPWE